MEAMILHKFECENSIFQQWSFLCGTTNRREKQASLWRVSFWPIAFISTQFPTKFFRRQIMLTAGTTVKWFAKFVEIIINHKFDVTNDNFQWFSLHCWLRRAQIVVFVYFMWCDAWSTYGIVRHFSCHHSSYSLAGKSLRWNSAKCNEFEQDYKRFMSELVLPVCRKWCSHTQNSINTAHQFLYYWATIWATSSYFSIRGELCEFQCTNVSNFFNWIHRIANDWLLFVQCIQHHHSFSNTFSLDFICSSLFDEPLKRFRWHTNHTR